VTAVGTGSDVPAVRSVLLRMAAAALAVLALVSALGVVVVRRIAEREAVNDASQQTDLLARTVIMPALEDALAGTVATEATASRARLDSVIRSRVLGAQFVRVKIWSPDGAVLYADEAALVGRRFTLDAEALAVLSAPATVAEISDLSRPENVFERGQGRLLEVYRPVWTPSGQPLLFETYTRYDTVTMRTGDLWRGFGGIVVSSLLLLLVLLAPLLWALLDRLRRGQRQRELLLRHAIDASEEERRRIAADLHDGVVQELVAGSLVIAAAAGRVRGRGAVEPVELAGELDDAAAAVRSAVGGLRTLLVDIYPPHLGSSGLSAVLDDLAEGCRGRGLAVAVQVDLEAADLPDDVQRLVYRVVREALRNTVKHARARHAWVTVRRSAAAGRTPPRLEVDVGDDGVGLTADARADAERAGHLGLRLLTDLVTDHGGTLAITGDPGQGTRWRMEVAL
jgi:signal transduction histidine kinase